jgi:uncharacterized protein
MKQRAAIAIFVKTPGLSPVKTRLAQTMGKDVAEKFYFLFTRAALEMVQEASLIADRVLGFDLCPFWAVAEEEGLQKEIWADLPSVSQGTGTLGERLDHVYKDLSSEFSSIFLMGADSPQLEPELIIDALGKVQETDFVLGRAEDGGFYILGGRKKIPSVAWRNVSYSVSATAKDLKKELLQLGSLSELPQSFDVDEEKDLIALLKHLEVTEGSLKGSKRDLYGCLKTWRFHD